LLAGQVPFPLKDNGETSRNHVMLSHMESPVPDLLELRKENLPKGWPQREMQVPDWLLEMIATCLEKSPEARYANGIELHEVVADSSVREVRVEVIKEVPTATVVPPAPIMVDKSNLINQPGIIRISSSVFAGLMILMAGFMAYSAYSLFKPVSKPVKPVNSVVAVDTARIVDSVRQADKARNEAIRAKRLQTDSAARSAINSALNKQKPDSTKTDSTANQ
jgi:eukaryotic-like serine/threonine-protein kinase